MSTMWPVAVLVALLAHVQASLSVPTSETPDYSQCYQCSKEGRQDEVQPRPTRTLIQVQLQHGFHVEQVEETQAVNENKHNVAWPHLEMSRVALGLQAQEEDQHRPAASIETKTNIMSTGLNITPKSHQQYVPTAQAETNSTSAGLSITHKSHQQYWPTAKVGIGAVQWLQILHVKSRRKIEAMVNGSGEVMQDLSLMLKYVLGFLFLVLFLLMALAACRSFSGNTHRFWPHHCRRQGPSPQVGVFSRAESRRCLGSPSIDCATPISSCHAPSGSFPQPPKQDQQQQRQLQQQHLPLLPLMQSPDQSRHKASLPASPAEDVSQGPCMCPELLVPPGAECRLLLPRVITVRPRERCTIVSPDGVAVFNLTLGGSWCTASHGKRLLTLHSAVTDGVVFASCDAVVSDQGKPEKLAINDGDGGHFADIQTCGADKSAMLTPHSGPSATIRYVDQQAGRILITNSNGKLLAIAEMIDDSVQAVRVGAKVDAGLITITMLSFNLLEPEHEVDS